MNPLRDNKEGKRRRETEGMGGGDGQERAVGFPILGSLRPTKHEITFTSTSSTPVGGILFLSLVPGHCLMKLREL